MKGLSKRRKAGTSWPNPVMLLHFPNITRKHAYRKAPDLSDHQWRTELGKK
jgi:hypothetical protein